MSDSDNNIKNDASTGWQCPHHPHATTAEATPVELEAVAAAPAVAAAAAAGGGGGEDRGRGENSSNNCCAICLCEYDETKSDVFSLTDCEHEFCKDCITTYIQRKAKDGEVMSSQMKCPSVSPNVCGCPIAQRDVLLCLQSQADKDRYLRLTIDRCVDAEDNMGCCPTPGCSFAFEWDKDNRKLDCPMCDNTFCLVCRSTPWHTGIRCEDYQLQQKAHQGGDDTDDAAFQSYASKQKLKQCPKCKFWVEKMYGCDAMRCRCNFVFCFNCGGGCCSLKKGNNTNGSDDCKVCNCGNEGLLRGHVAGPNWNNNTGRKRVAPPPLPEDDSNVDWKAEYFASQIQDQTIPNLKKYLRSVGLPSTGKRKNDLVSRVSNHVERELIKSKKVKVVQYKFQVK